MLYTFITVATATNTPNSINWHPFQQCPDDMKAEKGHLPLTKVLRSEFRSTWWPTYCSIISKPSDTRSIFQTHTNQVPTTLTSSKPFSKAATYSMALSFIRWRMSTRFRWVVYLHSSGTPIRTPTIQRLSWARRVLGGVGQRMKVLPALRNELFNATNKL